MLETLLEISLVPSKPHFPKFSHYGSCAWFMNQKNIHFWHGNELFISDSRSFHGLFMVTPCSLTDCVREEREHDWL